MSVLYSNFIVNDKEKVIFAYVPKVACSNWKGIMRYLNGAKDYLDTNLAHNRNLSGLKYLSDEDAPLNFLSSSKYKKYCFVRNPYTRILSAYLNKIESRIDKPFSQSDHFAVVYQDIENFRVNYLDEKNYPSINFEVFLIWLRDSNSMYTHDEHWRTQTMLLNIVKVEFDFIGRFEDLAVDAPKMLDMLGVKIEFPTQSQIKFSPTKAKEKADIYYSPVTEKLVLDLYESDFENFAYKKER